ncbi:MAG TPA: efflux RND transporter periplasmic adaptor subunit [Tepidisphaeraceae bacterium]|jgi:HlyD family secretion protein
MIVQRAQSNGRIVLISGGVVLLIVLMVWGIFVVTSPRVTVTEAVEGPVVAAFYSTGTIQPEREYPIKSNVAGTITEVRVDKGTALRKGDVLAVVSDPALQFQVDKAAAELKEKLGRADAKQSPVIQGFDSQIAAYQDLVQIARREVDRVTSLVAGSAAKQSDLDLATDRLKKNWSEWEALKADRASKLLELQKDVDVAQSALATAKWNLEQQTLKSPIDGVVLDRPTSVGTRLAINDPVMRIANVTPQALVMRAAVDEEDISKVRPDQTVRMTLYAFAGRSLEGAVTRIYDQADPDRRTFEVDVKLAQMDSHLQPGMTGELAFIMASKDRAVVVPSQAVQNGAIYVIKDGQLKKRDVQIGIRSVERTEILSGLTVGERVAISPVAGYRDAQRVRSSYTDPIVAAGLNKPPAIQEAFKGFQ